MAISYSSFFANIVEKERITCFQKPAYCTDCSANKNNSMAIILRPTPKLIADRYHYYSIAACPRWLRYCAAFSVVNLHATSTTSLFVTFCSEDFRSLDDVIAAFVVEQTDWRLSNFGRRAFNIHSLSVHGSDVWSKASRTPAVVRSAGVDRRGRGTSSSFYLNQATWPINKHTKAYRQTEWVKKCTIKHSNSHKNADGLAHRLQNGGLFTFISEFALLTIVGIWSMIFTDFAMDSQYSTLRVNLLSKPSL